MTTRSVRSRVATVAVAIAAAAAGTGLALSAPASAAATGEPVTDPGAPAAIGIDLTPTWTVATRSPVGTEVLTLRFSEAMRGLASGANSVSSGLRVLGATGTAVTGSWTASGRSATFTPRGGWVAGARYTVAVSDAVTDLTGKRVAHAAASLRAGQSVESTRLTGSGGWSTVRASNASGLSFVRSSVAKARVSAYVSGTGVVVRGCKSPTSGKATITVAGRRYAVDLYQPYSSCGSVFTSPTLPEQGYTVVVEVTHTRRVGSRGYDVGVDAVSVK